MFAAVAEISSRDILSRHEAAHQSDDIENVAPMRLRACLHCCSARVKCSRSNPCKRCSVRNLECRYPLQSKRKSRARRPPRNTESHQEDAETQLRNQNPPNEPMAMDDLHVPLWPADPYNTSNFYGPITPEQQNLPLSDLQMVNTAAVPEHYGVQRIFDSHPNSSQLAPATFLPHNLRYMIWNQDVTPDAAGCSSNTPNDFILPSNHSFCIPQLPELGYLAVNWLSSTNLDYNQYMFDSQDFPIDDINGTLSLPTVVPGQYTEGTEFQLAHQNVREHASPRSNAVTQTSIPSPKGSESQETASTPSRRSTYYVDGAGAREPRYGELRKRHSLWNPSQARTLEALKNQQNNWEFCFPSTIERQLNGHGNKLSHSISPQIYQKLVSEFKNHCLNTPRPFEDDYFPPIGIFEISVRLYFEYFHPVVPILHKVSALGRLESESESYLILLAMSAIGINYLGNKDASRCGEAFSEFLQRSLDHLEFTDNLLHHNDYNSKFVSRTAKRELVQIQAQTLSVVGMLFSCNESLVEKAYTVRTKLVTNCLRRKMLHETVPLAMGDTSSDPGSWKEWILVESNIRIAYCIWALDTIIAYQSDFRPQMMLEDAKIPLPCREEIWEASDATTWREAYTSLNGSPTLLTALEALYKKKTVNASVGEIGRILLIHGLYRRTYEVADYHRGTISNWIPSAPGTRSTSPSSSGVGEEDWLPGNSIFSKWRNGALDCLDVLHWSANSMVAQRAGLEHPTVLHLHLARLILLTPATTIQSLASTLLQNAKNGSAPSNSATIQYHKDRSEVMRWFIQDQYKARLAIVHAGAVFWHVRRYSHDSMFEPFAVFLSSLVIWAYATSSQAMSEQQGQRNGNRGNLDQQDDSISGLNSGSAMHPLQNGLRAGINEGHNTAGDSDAIAIDSPFINLDRLCDDELIQTFVLHGTKMTGYMAEIGNICQDGSCPKILRAGAKILASSGTHCGVEELEDDVSVIPIPTWGVASKNAAFLEELANVSERRYEQA